MNTHKDKGVNSKKIILDLCGGTGAWSRPYPYQKEKEEFYKKFNNWIGSSFECSDAEGLLDELWLFIESKMAQAKEAGREEILSLADGITYHVEDGKMADVRKDLLDYEKFLQELQSK